MTRTQARDLLKAVDRVVVLIESVLLWLAAVGLGIIMLLITYSAVARYVFSSPVQGSQVWVADVLAPAVTFFALSAALRARRHIGVTFVVTKLPPGVRLLTQTVAALLTMTVFMVIAYQGFLSTQRAATRNLIDSEIGIPLALMYGVVPLGCFVLALRSLLITFQWWVGDRSNVALSPVHEPASRTTDAFE